MNWKKKEGWPEGRVILLKDEKTKRVNPILLKEETKNEWVGWPYQWKEQGRDPGEPRVWSKLHWKDTAAGAQAEL